MQAPGFSFEFASEISATTKARCFLCKDSSSRRQFIVGTPAVLHEGFAWALCAPCTAVASWIWRGTYETPPLSAFPQNIGQVAVLLVTPRENDFVSPWGALALVSDGRLLLPQGLVSPSQSPEEAALFVLQQALGIFSWQPALEPLYTGYTPQGVLSRVFLCRAYAGGIVTEQGTSFSWEPFPFEASKSQHDSGFYAGVSEALALRAKFHRASHATTPLSLDMSGSAAQYLELSLSDLPAWKAGENRLLKALSYVLTPDEKEMCELILRALSRKTEVEAPKDEQPEAEEEDDEETREFYNAEAETDESEDAAAFVRAPLPRKQPRSG